MRVYGTKPVMYVDRFTEQVIQPDKNLIEALHSLLDNISDDNHALAIDLCVYQLLQFHNPNRQNMMTPPEIMEKK